MSNEIQVRNNEATVNVTYGRENGDLPYAVDFDSPDSDILSWVAESLRAGEIVGLSAVENPNFSGFVVDRFRANDQVGHRIQIRPKAEFGG